MNSQKVESIKCLVFSILCFVFYENIKAKEK